MLSCINRGEFAARAYHQDCAFMPDILGFADSDQRSDFAAPIKKADYLSADFCNSQAEYDLFCGF